MKTTNSIFTKITLGLLIAGSMAACNNNKGAATTASITPPSADKEPIVYVNSDSLLSKYEYAKDVSKHINDMGNVAQSDNQSKEQAYQREVAEYQKDAAAMPADKRQTTETRLLREKQEIQSFEQNAGAEFQKKVGTENGKLFDKITDFAKQYAKEKGYKMVLTYSKASPTILYGDASLDVTADVVKRLNDAYTKEKK